MNFIYYDLYIYFILIICNYFIFSIDFFGFVESIDIRIGVFDWQSFEDGTIWDGDFSKGMGANFILAAHHFNERRIDLIPDLELVKNCNKNISIVRYCETAGNIKRASHNTLYLLKNFNIHAICK